jgi:transketolase
MARPPRPEHPARHGSPLGPDEIAGARKALGWDYEPFVVPNELMDAWRKAGSRGAADPAPPWAARLAASPKKEEFTRRTSGKLPANFDAVIAGYKQELAKNPPALATRNASQNALDVINAAVPRRWAAPPTSRAPTTPSPRN